MIIQGKKQAVRTVWNATGTPTEKPATTSTDFKAFIDTDAVLNSNLRQLQDGIFEKYPRVDKSLIEDQQVSEEVIKQRNQDLLKVDFGQKVKDSYTGLWHNGNMFFDIDVVGTKVIGFYMIDPDTMKVIEDDYGNVIKYIQSQPGGDKEIPKNRIIHIKAPSLKTGTLGEPLLKPLDYPLHRKRTAENYLAGMIENLHPLLALNIDGNDDTQITDIQNSLRSKRSPLDPLKLITLFPDEKVQRVDTGTTSNFDAIQRYIDAQNDEIIRVVQIPPIVAGTVDNSNRSNSEIQERAVFGRTTNAWQNFVIDKLNEAFKEKAGWKGTTFEFPVEDKRKRESALIEATKFKDLGYSQDAYHEYLISQGVKINKDFAEEPVDIKGSEDLSKFESRQPRSKEGIPQNEEQRKKDAQNGTKKVNQ